MKRMIKFLTGAAAGAFLLGFVVSRMEEKKEEKITGKVNKADKKNASQKKTYVEKHLPCGIYEKYLKRPFDFTIALLALVFLCPVYLAVALLVRARLGKPVLFKQERPGRDGKIFQLYKFRTMTDERDENGELLSDEERLTEFGKWLRSTSLDELPELFNILKGDMSLVGPRPLLVEYLPRYSAEQARRHEVLPGLTGLAQVSGRNAISWEEKFEDDVRYVDHITFWMDLKIIFWTIAVVLKRKGISSDTAVTMEAFMGSEGDKEKEVLG